MTREQKTAMARIISDMIKADNIIEASEIRDMKILMSRYSLTQQDMSDARKIRFSDAVMRLQNLAKRDRKAFFNAIYDIALSDNVCVPKEALLLIALQYGLVEHDRRDANGNIMPKPYLISCPTSDSSISDQYMVYLESSYDQEHNEEVMKDFKLLVTQSRLNGFNFIYIPKMVEEFKEMDSHYVKDVISYMAPQLNEDHISNVYERLCKMTTAEFFHSVLYEKLHVEAIYDTKPSILINIGTSVVPYCAADGSIQYYTEFLCIPIATTTLTLVEDILKFYHSKVSIKTITITDNEGQFKYFGFYKALFDFLIAPPPVAPDLVFLGQDRDQKFYIAFKFEEGKERKVHLHPRQYELYLEVVTKTYKSRTKGMPTAQLSDISAMSKLRSALSEGLKDISFSDQYKPERKNNLYVIRLDKSKVFIRTNKNNKDFIDVPIAEYNR